ncbi:hypothetical protein L1049_026410 [Liquidambar formosana]|uniref:Uncharacterized protein n=1 Tax=Liquidambar formosana TaxID=63359 RepID=A0AAP0R7A6_LIQFO
MWCKGILQSGSKADGIDWKFDEKSEGDKPTSNRGEDSEPSLKSSRVDLDHSSRFWTAEIGRGESYQNTLIEVQFVNGISWFVNGAW